MMDRRIPELLGDAIWQSGVCYPQDIAMTALAQEEAEYHDHFDEEAALVHQLGAYRNELYHKRLWRLLADLPNGSRVLEVGAGSGYDASHIASHCSVVLSDVSGKTLERLLKRTKLDLPAVVADGEHLPFHDQSFDGLYMVATWHHMASPAAALQEAARVLRPGALIVLAIEPNRFYFTLIKLFRPLLTWFTHMRGVDVSHADEEMVGFSRREIAQLFKTGEWSDLKVEPMWLLAGWLHYILEFLFRAFRLKRRIVIPGMIEMPIVWFDELLFQIPGVANLSWHHIVVAKRSSVL